MILSVDELPVSLASATTRRHRRRGVEREGEGRRSRAGVTRHVGLANPPAFDPSTGVKLEIQVVPPSIEYATIVPASMLERVSVPAFGDAVGIEPPLSVASATPAPPARSHRPSASASRSPHCRLLPTRSPSPDSCRRLAWLPARR